VVNSRRDQNRVRTSTILDQPHEISSPKSLTNRGKHVIGGIQPKFVYQFTSLDYYELMEH
jgi:hypothetical protein